METRIVRGGLRYDNGALIGYRDGGVATFVLGLRRHRALRLVRPALDVQ